MAIDKDNNLYLTGCIPGTTNMNGKQVKAAGLKDIVVTKLDHEGNTVWFNQYGADGVLYENMPVDLETGNNIAVDENCNVYFAGIHYDGAKFGDLTLHTDAKLGNLKVGNIFLAKLNAGGKIEWVKNAESTKSAATITGLVCDKQGNSYLSAVIGVKKVFFDGHKANGPFVAKFNPNGELEWINDAEKTDFWASSKVDINLPGGLAINESNDYLYITGNAVKKDSDTNYALGVQTVTSESIIAICKIRTGE